ncbi:mitochondrial putative glutamate--tRNA ligase [Echria macrotheca]|uniref:Glutamate--tRNA ligase, mitochondrial n=1 Tax=Echria macrotheca TaxID=438768 RepID=A0AAJ0B4W3_9PEZI|nr:mitochondrial putative glutamate--tRNA ligase [Echria macrotheca]
MMRGVFLPGRPLSPLRLQLRLSTRHRVIARQFHKSRPGTRPTDLPTFPCRTRFAPSPTGYLHLGSLRTALYNYLLAKATGGQFILRIEDTDQVRTVPDAEKRLVEDLHWAGLSWDEGPDKAGPYGPYRQSERLELYHTHAAELIASGKAYRCFCSKEQLLHHNTISHEQGGRTGYPGTCRSISPEESEDRAARGESHVVRFRSPAEPTRIQDLVFNSFRKKDPEEDFVIIKSDGFPTYHFANVVDDRKMAITHVIRGSEWLLSTPKHVDLYNAFGWEPPRFAHVGLLVDMNQQKLSKRHPGVDVTYYKDNKILPAALLNFAVLLGWSTTDVKGDVMTLEDMVKYFRPRFTKGDIKVSMEKLSYLQQHHLKRLSESSAPQDAAAQREYLIDPLQASISREEAARLANKTEASSIPPALIGQLVPDLQETTSPDDRRAYLQRALQLTWQLKTPNIPEYMLATKYLFWQIPREALTDAYSQHGLAHARFSSSGGTAAALRAALAIARAVPEEDWGREGLIAELADTLACVVGEGEGQPGRKGGYTLMRWVLLRSEAGVSLAQFVAALGKEEVVRRFEVAVEVSEGV